MFLEGNVLCRQLFVPLTDSLTNLQNTSSPRNSNKRREEKRREESESGLLWEQRMLNENGRNPFFHPNYFLTGTYIDYL